MVDAHIHIDFYDNPGSIVHEIIENKETAIFVTHLPELYNKQRKAIEPFSNIHIAVGYHPILVNEYDFNQILFNQMLETTNFIGEVGLDYTVARSLLSKQKQNDIFNRICYYSNKHVLSIHSRQAEEDVLKILEKNDVKLAVFHWYSGPKELINDILNRGYYFSLNPAMLRSPKGKSILKEIPLSNILIETDGPFVKYNETLIRPKFMKEIYEAFSEFYGVQNLEKIIHHNFSSLIENTF